LDKELILQRTLGPHFYKVLAQDHQVSLILCIGAGFMATGTPEEVSNRVRHYIEVGRKDGSFALYLCNLGASTLRDNVRAAIDAARIWSV
jgi:hypothetical protein